MYNYEKEKAVRVAAREWFEQKSSDNSNALQAFIADVYNFDVEENNYLLPDGTFAGDDYEYEIVKQFNEMYFGQFDDEADFGCFYFYEINCYKLPDNLEYYFDFENYGRDMLFDYIKIDCNDYGDFGIFVFLNE